MGNKELVAELRERADHPGTGSNTAQCMREAADALAAVSDTTPSEGRHFHIWSETPCKPGECRLTPPAPVDREITEDQVRLALEALSRFNEWTENHRGAMRAALCALAYYPDCDGCPEMGGESDRCPRHGLNHSGLWAEIDRLRTLARDERECDAKLLRKVDRMRRQRDKARRSRDQAIAALASARDEREYTWEAYGVPQLNPQGSYPRERRADSAFYRRPAGPWLPVTEEER